LLEPNLLPGGELRAHRPIWGQPLMADPAGELGSLAELPTAVAADITSCVEGVHKAIAERAFSALGPAAWPVKAAHDGIARTVYASVRGGFRLAGRAARAAVAAFEPADKLVVSDGRGGALLISSINGVTGDRLEREQAGLAIEMSVRVRNRNVPLSASNVKAAFPRASRGVALFVHGLCENEHSWEDQDGRSYGSRLLAETGRSPVFLRYNTGGHISENGRRLDRLLDALTAAWPVQLTDIALVGHSMGGLVIRSACHYGTERNAPWTAVVRHVFFLGSPHLGAPLEKVANVLGAALSVFPESRPFAGLLNNRSAGIKDLRFGALVDDHWRADGLGGLLESSFPELPLLPTAEHHFAAATLARHPRSLAAWVFGDGLVRVPSATGQGRNRTLGLAAGKGRRLSGAHHFQLLNHPLVYEQIRSALALPAKSSQTT
jgi:hypothetical protein